MKKQKFSSVLLCSFFAVIVLGLAVYAWVKPAGEYSDSERRPLEPFPKLDLEALLSADFMSDFETYTLDQFPFRDGFRAIKVFTELNIFNKKESNDLYLEDGYIGKIEYPLNEELVVNAADKFAAICDKYVKDDSVNVYLSIVPDKHYFLGEANGYPHIDYELLEELVLQETQDKMEYIDIFDLLTVEDYYLTDTHWKQEEIVHVADALLEAMGAAPVGELTENRVDGPFKGVYYGQLGLPVGTDELVYLTGESLDSCTVTSYDSGMPQSAPMYDLAAAEGKDPYEIFLCGADALVTVENPNATTDRELVIFRDSFGSSIAPLLCGSYSKVTLVDIRYMYPDHVGAFVDFTDCDVLFLYSALVLNNSSMLR